jgi:Protein of unknown function (DUF3800)
MREGALRLIRVVIADGGALLVLAESYFDETNTHKGAERLCVGGYVFHKKAAERQAIRWAELIDKWHIPYFHMVDCAHNAGVFKHLTCDECDLAAREAIQIIKDTASTGICVTMSEADYLEIVPQLKFYGSAYDACARDVMVGVSAWIERTDFKGAMHYYFEEGTDTQNNASWSILEMMKVPELRKIARYEGHSFVPKIRSPGVQAADILAWHAGQDCKRALQEPPLPMRKDFQSLCEISHSVVHIDRKMLEATRDIINSELAASGASRDLISALHEAEKRLPKNKRR